MAQLELVIGQSYSMTPKEVGEASGDPMGYKGSVFMGATSDWGRKLPAGMTLTKQLFSGTPTAFEGGEFLSVSDDYGDMELRIDLVPAAPPVTMIEPPAVERTEAGYTLPEAEGVAWTVDGDPAAPGTYTPDTTAGPVTVTILATAAEGYEFEPPAEPVTLTFEPAPGPDPDPEPDPDAGWEWTEGTTAGGDLVARFLKWTTEAQREQAAFYHHIVLAYVWGYTKGRGFSDELTPAKPLERVIVSAASRLAYNPESVSRWQVSSESEAMTVFHGFNLAEQQILNRYRRRFA